MVQFTNLLSAYLNIPAIVINLPLSFRFSFQSLLFHLQYLIQGIKTLVPKLPQLPGPGFQFEHGLWIDLVNALLRPFYHLHQPGLTENFKVL